MALSGARFLGRSYHSAYLGTWVRTVYRTFPSYFISVTECNITLLTNQMTLFKVYNIT